MTLQAHRVPYWLRYYGVLLLNYAKDCNFLEGEFGGEANKKVL